MWPAVIATSVQCKSMKQYCKDKQKIDLHYLHNSDILASVILIRFTVMKVMLTFWPHKSIMVVLHVWNRMQPQRQRNWKTCCLCLVPLTRVSSGKVHKNTAVDHHLYRMNFNSHSDTLSVISFLNIRQLQVEQQVFEHLKCNTVML